MPDGPVTGSCEQCGRKYALIVPEAGSGDLALERMTALFSSCAECGQLVGRDCCWGSDRSCVRCARARAASGEVTGGFAALGAARAAVRQLDGTSAHFSAVEATISATADAGSTPMDAWERSWLAAGVLRARIEGSRDAARSWLRALPPGEDERATELHEELLAVEASLQAKWRSIEEALRVAGQRLARRPGLRRRAAATAIGQRPSVPAAVAVALPIPIAAPDRVVIHVQTPVPTRSSSQLAVVSSGAPTSAPVRPMEPAPIPAPARPDPRAEWAGPSVPTAMVPAEMTAPPAMTSERAGRPGRAAGLLIAVAALGLAAGIFAVNRLPGAVANRTSDPAGVTDPGVDATAAAGIEAPLPSTSAGAPASPPIVITVDHHRVGPLDPEEHPFTRIIGAPEVAAFPTPFDRSLRLPGVASGFCFALSPLSEGGASSMAFDLHLGESPGVGRLTFALPHDGSAAAGLGLDLATFGELDHEAWYRLTVTGGGTPGRVEVTALGDPRPLLSAELGGDATFVPMRTDEVCIQASHESPEASLLIDNLRVDR